MTFKEYVEDTFGTDADERVPAYVMEYFDGLDEAHPFQRFLKSVKS